MSLFVPPEQDGVAVVNLRADALELKGNRAAIDKALAFLDLPFRPTEDDKTLLGSGRWVNEVRMDGPKLGICIFNDIRTPEDSKALADHLRTFVH